MLALDSSSIGSGHDLRNCLSFQSAPQYPTNKFVVWYGQLPVSCLRSNAVRLPDYSFMLFYATKKLGSDETYSPRSQETQALKPFKNQFCV